eukprot:7838099-Alexandrium_andersonii.AAC.1
MSASLVGSEMCIRDSFVTPHRFDLGSPEAAPPLALQHFLDAIDGLGAVSYTHLTLPTICSV